jgi:hypothetical protein
LFEEQLAKIFHSVCCLFILVIVSFDVQVFILMKSHLLILVSISWAIGVLFTKSLPPFIPSSVFSVFSSSSFRFSGLTLSSLTCFELSFVEGER